jgi:two-component system response regulator RegX3
MSWIPRDDAAMGQPARTARDGPDDDAHQPGSCQPERTRLLVVEDDKSIAEPLVERLRREGFDTRWVDTAAKALSATGVDLLLLDLRLPDMDGYEACRRLRQASLTPIIVVTARGREIDKVVCLELGADDYLVKPFGFRELVARIRAVLRRSRAARAGSSREGKQSLGRLVIDRRTRRVLVDDQECVLAPKEFDLLAILADDPGAVVGRSDVLTTVWARRDDQANTLNTHVGRLRKKLGHPEWIETVRGVGLRLGPTDRWQ